MRTHQFFKQKETRKKEGSSLSLNNEQKEECANIAKKIIDTAAEEHQEELKQELLARGVSLEKVDEALKKIVEKSEQKGIEKFFEFLEESAKAELLSKNNQS